jgi:hypothetical protein
MAEQTLDLQTLAKRLEKVERQNRRIKLAGCLALIFTGVILLMGQAFPLSQIDAKCFRVFDEKGKARIVIGTTEGWPGPMPCLGIMDERGEVRVMLGVDAEGSPHLSFNDERGKARVGLGMGKDGNCFLSFLDKSQKPIWIFP